MFSGWWLGKCYPEWRGESLEVEWVQGSLDACFVQASLLFEINVILLYDY